MIKVIFDFAEGARGPSASTKILLPLVFDLGQYININNSIKVSRQPQFSCRNLNLKDLTFTSGLATHLIWSTAY